jgi:hypothetical protein
LVKTDFLGFLKKIKVVEKRKKEEGKNILEYFKLFK